MFFFFFLLSPSQIYIFFLSLFLIQVLINHSIPFYVTFSSPHMAASQPTGCCVQGGGLSAVSMLFTYLGEALWEKATHMLLFCLARIKVGACCGSCYGG